MRGAGTCRRRLWLVVVWITGATLWAADPPRKVDIYREYRDLGLVAYNDRNYASAERYFRQYFQHAAADTATMVEASELLVKTLLAQQKLDDASKVAASIPDRLQAMQVMGVDTQLAPVLQLRLHLLQGEVQLRRGQGRAALEQFQQAERLVSGDERWRVLQAQAQAQMQLGAWAPAEALLRQVMRGTSGELGRQARIGLVQVLNEQAKYADALTRISELLATSDPQEKAALTWQQMRALLGLKRPKEANERFRELAAVAPPAIAEPAEYLLLQHLVPALVTAGELENALALQERVAPLLREEAWRQEWLLARAELNNSVDRLPQAAELFQSFAELYPRDERRHQAQFSAAAALARQQLTDRALALYGKLLADDTAPLTLRYQAGYNQALVQRDQKKDGDAAIKTLQVLQGLPLPEPAIANTHFTLAELHLQREEARPAAELYGEVVALLPKSDLARLARFRQGVALSQLKSYGPAAQSFAQFLSEWPGDPELAADATFRQGQAEFLAGTFGEARETFRSFIRLFPESPLMPRVLAEASNAAAAADLTREAIDLLTELLTRFKEGDEVAWALYRRTYLRLAVGMAAEAIQDSTEFLRLYGSSRPLLAANVYIWLGDHYQGQGKFSEAENHFLRVPELYPDTKDAPTALYTAAKVAYQRAMSDNQNPADLARAAQYLAQLDTRYPQAADRLKAQALFLNGDILSLKGDFKAAALQFEAASRLVPKTSLHYAALGRKAECHALLATRAGEDKAKLYEQALALLQQVIDAEGAGETLAALKTKARYRKARILETIGDRTQAITEYDGIFHSFRAPYNLKFDWYYFSRAGFDLARLHQQDQQYSHALQIYRAMEKTQIPTAREAKERADVLEQRLRK